MKKVNIYYNNDELTGDDEVKVLEIPDEIINAINDSYVSYISFLRNLKDSKDRTKNSNNIKINKLLIKYKKSKRKLEEFIFNSIGFSPFNYDNMSGFFLVEDAETEEALLEY